jgi:hypothetical protein
MSFLSNNSINGREFVRSNTGNFLEDLCHVSGDDMPADCPQSLHKTLALAMVLDSDLNRCMFSEVSSDLSVRNRCGTCAGFSGRISGGCFD